MYGKAVQASDPVKDIVEGSFYTITNRDSYRETILRDNMNEYFVSNFGCRIFTETQTIQEYQ